MIAAYERNIDELEQQKLVFEEKASETRNSPYSFEQLFELSMCFLSSPYNIWRSGRFELQRMVLKLTFSQPLDYCRETDLEHQKPTYHSRC
ncbi:MAG: hypothetical protein ABJP66_05675 [Hyphomicrobiales bacterium]